MRLTDIAIPANALRWYGLPAEEQYVGDNVQLYDRIAAMGGRSAYAHRITEFLGGVSGQILEIGAGTGLVSRALAARHGDRLLCTDIEPAVLALNPHTNKRVADCCELPVEHDSTQAVVGIGLYRYMRGNTTEKFWPEMHRVLTRDGRLILGEFHPRLFGMRGSRLEHAQTQGLFSLESVEVMPAKVRLGRMAIGTGQYQTHVFRRST